MYGFFLLFFSSLIIIFNFFFSPTCFGRHKYLSGTKCPEEQEKWLWGNFLEDLRDHNSETSKVIAVCELLSLLFSVESVSSFHKHTTPSHSGIQFTGGTHQRGYSADQRQKKKEKSTSNRKKYLQRNNKCNSLGGICIKKEA